MEKNIGLISSSISCINCSQHFHTDCINSLNDQNNYKWRCDSCFFKLPYNELPFADKLIHVDYDCSLSKGLKIAHVNIQSLRNKIDHINMFLHNNDINILCITESWLTDDIDNNELAIPG